jgi:uncharacterized membrane protein YphA (DoxX/SURF4 family)
MSPKIRTGLTWTLRIVLALLFTLAALPKMAGAESWITRFEDWGYPVWFMYVTGALELAGAGGLLIPKISRLAALGLIAVMMGAVLTHAVAGERPRVPINLGYAVALVSVWWLQRPETPAHA